MLGIGEDPRNAKILIIDDDRLSLMFARQIAHDAGFNTILTTASPAEGIALYRRERPDVVVLDLVMPGMSGLEVLAALREDDPAKVMPVIVVTGGTDSDSHLAALGGGAMDFVVKPYRPCEFQIRLRNTAIISLLQRSLEAQNRTLEGEITERTARLERAIAALKVAEARLVRELTSNRRVSARQLDHISREFRTVLKAVAGYARVFGDQAFGPLGHPRYVAYANDIDATTQSTLELLEKGFMVGGVVTPSAAVEPA